MALLRDSPCGTTDGESLHFGVVFRGSVWEQHVDCGEVETTTLVKRGRERGAKEEIRQT